ncbi:complement regulator-acquiring protein [Borreliella lanei]|uniref:Lipoprotein n=1 Tax=Borreliella lanei TaxID=373540 RepID=A0A7W9ZE68_9SPIR|nr:complement regulator-acquiring protein [Borreliella lanei]MBB6208329.1 hypothetical protein [Borreliella lanei]WKC85860.1 complement regulator-acquiring protein [Borreliella lanei]
MTKTKRNTIKLSIIAAILILICISCAVNPFDLKINSYTDLKESSENFKNESGNPKSSNQKSPKETAIAKLKEFGNKLKTQKNEEDNGMAKNPNKDNLTDTLKVYPMYYGKDKTDTEELEKATENTFTVVSAEIQKTEKLQIERIIQSSLNYEKEEINKLKEILETLKGGPEYEDIIRIFLYHKALNIQAQLDKHLKSIQEDNLNTLSEKELKELLINVEFDLMLKEKFKKTLAKTVNEVYPEIKEIEKDYSLKKSKEGLDIKILEENENIIKKYYVTAHIYQNYQIFDYATYDTKSKQNKFNELQVI